MKEEIRREYQNYLETVRDHYTGGSCFNHKCKGIMGESISTDHILTCTICGTGLKAPSYEDWVNGAIQGSKYAVQRAQDAIKYNNHKIDELKREIAELKEDNKTQRVLIKSSKAKVKRFRGE